MRTKEDVLEQLAYHPATSGTARRHDDLRHLYMALVDSVWDLIPDGAEKTTCMRKLQESLMYANLSVALTAPIDADTSSIARVLPSGEPPPVPPSRPSPTEGAC